jgi:hypothetical protein
MGGQNWPRFSASPGTLLHFFTLCLMLITISRASSVFITPPQFLVQSSTLNNPTNESSLLECLQVAPPIAIPSAACQQTLMVHKFAFSYGQPFIGTSWSRYEGSEAVCELHTSVLAQMREGGLTARRALLPT